MTNSNSRIHISCVVDDDPKFVMQAWNWLLSLRATKSEARPFVLYIGDALTESTLAFFNALGATTIKIEAFEASVSGVRTPPEPYCNKIQQLSVAPLTDCDWLILSDADIIFLDAPEKLVNGSPFRAKIVDLPNPPRSTLEPWLDAIGQPWGESAPCDFEPGGFTLDTNFNGGVYVVAGSISQRLGASWARWANELIETQHIAGRFAVHADQVSMALAVRELGVEHSNLGVEWNFPTHFRGVDLSRYELLTERNLSALHYHNCMDVNGLPSKLGIGWIDSKINAAIGSIVEGRRENFSNEIFWQYRYKYAPQLGSGLGSRDEGLAAKQEILSRYFSLISAESIVDVGCGDLESVRSQNFTDYLGIDIASEAIEICRGKRPDWLFRVARPDQIADKSSAVVLCLDVLIHQPDIARAREMVDQLIRIARRSIVLSIHSSDEEMSGISFNTHQIRSYLETHPEVLNFQVLGSFRDVDIIAVDLKVGHNENANDISTLDLLNSSGYTHDREALLEFVRFSRSKFGFFPRTVIRAVEYPWFAERLTDVAEKVVVDLGAGVCALPLLLAERGARVFTIDLHEIKRNGTDARQWNEWGFLDYAEFDPRVTSLNIDMSNFVPPVPPDVVYSVSVIEHMPAQLRRSAIDRIASWSKSGTELLLSVDLEPDTERLWNLSEGEVVDEHDHGSLTSMLNELSSSGFVVSVEAIVRGVPKSRTDVAFVRGEFKAS